MRRYQKHFRQVTEEGQKGEEKFPEDYFEVKICRAMKKYGFVGEWNEIAVDEKIAEIID